MVWRDGELADMASSFQDVWFGGEGDVSPHADIRHSLESYTRFWNRTQEYRQHARLHHPDIYGAMMAPLKECPQFLGDPAAGHIIAWRLKNRR